MFRAEVEVKDGSPSEWYTNSLRFDTEEKASEYLKDLGGRWMTMVRGRVVDDSVPLKEPVDPTDSRIVVDWS